MDTKEHLINNIKANEDSFKERLVMKKIIGQLGSDIESFVQLKGKEIRKGKRIKLQSRIAWFFAITLNATMLLLNAFMQNKGPLLINIIVLCFCLWGLKKHFRLIDNINRVLTVNEKLIAELNIITDRIKKDLKVIEEKENQSNK